jgi:hypothetical protein
MRQERPTENQSIWDLSNVQLPVIGNPDYHAEPWVRWRERIWLRKFKEVSVSEVVGYQLAEAIGLPVQPWAAFYSATTEACHSGCGILIEQWPLFYYCSDLCLPAMEFPELVSTALAFVVFNRFEWPQWMVAESRNNLRLFDLEFIGPKIHWPPETTPTETYSGDFSAAYREAEEKSIALRLHAQFLEALRRFTSLNFSTIIDFRGHPCGQRLKKLVVEALENRKSQITRLMEFLNDQ